jgi:hypothetical protein
MKIITNLLYVALVALAFGCFTLSPSVRAVDPPPPGGYSAYNTAAGNYALFHLTTGAFDTAVGYGALFQLTEAGFNTAVGGWFAGW